MRVFAKIAYNGASYLGSQIQKETPNTIFGHIEDALSRVGINYRVVASGRTDRGVHATSQVCHFDLPPFWQDLVKLKRVLNQMLPSTIRIRAIYQVADDMHARFSTKKRSYRYIIKEGEVNPFESDFITYLPKVDFAKIEQNISLFIGEHDFVYFLKRGSEVNSTRRIIYKAFAYKHKGYIVLYFEANGFLRSQIRMMVSALLRFDAKKITEKLSGDINHKVTLAPPNGLYLSKITY